MSEKEFNDAIKKVERLEDFAQKIADDVTALRDAIVRAEYALCRAFYGGEEK